METRPHESLIPLHEAMFQRIERDLANLVALEKERVTKYDKHIEEGYEYRGRIDKHDLMLADLLNLKRWLVGTIFSVIFSLGVWLISWGGVTKQIEINTARILDLERIHPRLEVK